MIRIFDKLTGESFESEVSVEFVKTAIARYIRQLEIGRERGKKRYVSTGKPVGRPKKAPEPEPTPEPEPEPEPKLKPWGRPRKYQFPGIQQNQKIEELLFCVKLKE
jgi:hypothetical protein